ncbi:MAG TPA: alpha/beta hydrolase [Ktedonosporobacter sp.]|nr:alpha/beta hydrolase [Ktedonosporobacter sp.]
MSIKQPPIAISAASSPHAVMHTHRVYKVVRWLLLISGLLSLLYTSISVGVAIGVVYGPPQPVVQTPAAFGLPFRNVTFTSREDHLALRGWFIPGVLPDGRLTSERTLILVHGLHSNRASPLLLGLSAALARRGFAVLDFDLRGHGQSAPAPLAMGLFEQRDVLGAVDFLRSGPLPYPDLGHPRVIGGWGDSMGGATMLLAAAHEPAIRAVVTDSAFAAIVPLLRESNVPLMFLPGVLTAIHDLYGINYYAARPVDVVAKIAPRPIFFIQGAADTVVPPDNMRELARAAAAAHQAHIQTWMVPGANHIESFAKMGDVYANRVAGFFATALGSN